MASSPVSAGSLTNLVLVLGALVAAYIVPVVLTRRKSDDDQETATVAAWGALNTALQTEISRLQAELSSQRQDYQRQLDSARGRITELEHEVATLQRALRGGAT